MGANATDGLLVKRVQAGDKSAFDVLVNKYQHKIVNLVTRYVKDNDEALDVSQEAFLKAYRALPNFRGDSAFYTWLYRIAVNTAKNHLVAVKRRPMDYDLDLQDPEQYEMHARLKDGDTPGSGNAEGRDARRYRADNQGPARRPQNGNSAARGRRT